MDKIQSLNTPKLYSIKELAKLISRHPITVYRDLKNKSENLPKHIVIGRRVFFTQEAVEAFLRGEKAVNL